MITCSNHKAVITWGNNIAVIICSSHTAVITWGNHTAVITWGNHTAVIKWGNHTALVTRATEIRAVLLQQCQEALSDMLGTLRGENKQSTDYLALRSEDADRKHNYYGGMWGLGEGGGAWWWRRYVGFVGRPRS